MTFLRSDGRDGTSNSLRYIGGYLDSASGLYKLGLDNSVAFALTVVVAVATGMTVGYVTQRTLKKMQK